MHIHLDPIGGLAGDMFVAAMLDAMPELKPQAFADIAAVLPPQIGACGIEQTDVSGITAAHFRFTPHDPHGLDHHGPLRHYTEFAARIACAGLANATTAAATDILTRLAHAEAAIHGVPLNDVHFHELSDWDALVDVVAAGSISAALSRATWSCGQLPTGRGLVKTAHGLLPVPAPATAAILVGYDWYDDGLAGERVTPTGAAILAHVTNGQGNGQNIAGRSRNIGYGAGTRRFVHLPNILRATVFAVETATSLSMVNTQIMTTLTFDIDDMTGEEIASSADILRQVTGVQDVTLVATTGKKGRPAVRFDVLTMPPDADRVVAAIFDETATIGLRRMDVVRNVLQRQYAVCSDGFRQKLSERPTGKTVKVENDDLREIPTLAARRRARVRSEHGDET